MEFLTELKLPNPQYMTKFTISFGMLLFVLVANAQNIDFSNYQNIQHSGQLPKDVTTSTASKYEQDSRNISSDDKRAIRKAQDQFYQESNFILDELVSSGKVYFNDPITQYVNEVADELLKEDPKLRKKLKIYSVKNGSPNAFTTNDGKILVHWGLLNKLENEAQLAAVLAHEIIHYRDEHVIESVTESVKIEKGEGLYRRFSELDKLTATTNFSKEKEMDADMEGLDIYLNSDYPPAAFLEIFDVLAYGHTPFDNKEFPISFFNTDSLFSITDNYKVITYNEIKPDDGEDSETHPALTDRKVKIFDELGAGAQNDSPYLVSEKRFKECQKMARYELGKLYLYYKDYPLSVYHNWLLLQEDPNSAYLHKNILKGIYGVAKFKNYGEYGELARDYDMFMIQGQSKKVYKLFAEIEGEEATILALTLAQNYLEKYDKDDVEVNKIAEDLIKELVLEYDYTEKSFKNRKGNLKAGESGKKKVEKEEETGGSWLAKDEKKDKDEKKEEPKNEDEVAEIKIEVEEIKTEEERENENEALENRELSFDLEFVIMNEDFKELVSKTIKKKEKLKSYRESMSNSEYSEFRAYINKKGYSLGAKKVTVVDPFYFKIDTRRKKNPIDYLAIENAETEIVEILQKNADKLDLKMEVLSAEKMKANSAEAFNDMAFLKYWFADQLSNGKVDILSIDYERAQELSKKYGSPTFMWTGVMSAKYKKPSSAIAAILLAALYPTALPTALGAKKETLFYTFIFDLEDDDLLMYDYNEVELLDTKATLNSNIYYQLLQVQRKRKK